MCLSIKRSIAPLVAMVLVAVYIGCSDESDSNCPTCPTGTSPEVKTEFVSAESDEYRLSWLSGDSDYGNNNGPRVVFHGRAYVKGVDSLMCFVSMTAVEQGNGDTMGERGVDVCVWVAPSGWKITSIEWEPCDIRFEEDGHGWHQLSCNHWIFYYVGDTSGADICDDADCSRFKFTFIGAVDIQKL